MSENTETTTTTTETFDTSTISAYLRMGFEEGAPMYADFEFMKVQCRLLADPDDLSVRVLRVLKDGKLGAEIAQGNLQPNKQRKADDAKAPHIKGIFRTKKQSWFEVAGWKHLDEVTGEAYFSLRMKPYQRRAGKCFSV